MDELFAISFTLRLLLAGAGGRRKGLHRAETAPTGWGFNARYPAYSRRSAKARNPP